RILDRYEKLVCNYYKDAHKFCNTMIIDKDNMKSITFFETEVLRWIFQKLGTEENLSKHKLNFIYKTFYTGRNFNETKFYLLNKSIRFFYETIFSDFSEIEIL